MALLRQAVVPVALLLAGVAVAIFAGDSTAAIAVAISLVGTAGVVAIAITFFAIGKAEDRDREALERRAPRAGGEAAHADARRPSGGAAHPADRAAPTRPAGSSGGDPHAAERPRTLGLGPERRRRRPPRRPG